MVPEQVSNLSASQCYTVASMKKLAAVLIPISLGVLVCHAASPDAAAVLLDARLRSARLRASLLDAMGNPIENVGWNKAGEFKQVTQRRWVPIVRDGKKSTMMMFRPLLIPGAPWMFWNGEILAAASEGAPARKVGDESYHPIRVPGQEPMKLRMWKTTETSGKWVGVDGPKIYECGEDGAGAQIGSLAFRELALESGEVVLVFMTKGMAPASAWEGDVAGTTYREAAGGKGKPIAKLAFRPVKLEDGTEAIILMSRPLTAVAAWTGVWNGKVIRAAGK
jgi:hypothetical protein